MELINFRSNVIPPKYAGLPPPSPLTRTSCPVYLTVIQYPFKPQPNDSYIATQHIPTSLAQHFQAPAKLTQHFNATDCNIVWHNMLHTFGHLVVATCCNMLRVENRTSAHAQEQHCWTNMAKRLQHHVTSTNVA